MPWRKLMLMAAAVGWLVPLGATAERAEAQTSGCHRYSSGSGEATDGGFGARVRRGSTCPGGSTPHSPSPSPGGTSGSPAPAGGTGPRCGSQSIATGPGLRQTFTGGSEFGLVMQALPSLPSGLRLADATLNDQNCDDGSGGLFWTGLPGDPPPGTPGGAPGPTFVPPEVIAETLFLQLDLPSPELRIDVGIATQLETRLGVDNESLTVADSGLVVTATPVTQHWEILGVPGGAPPVVCEPGQPPEQECTWTPNHSSATVDPAVAGERDGSPCFPVTVTVTWAGEWALEGGGGGTIAETRDMTIDECLVVGEIQALNG